MKKIIASIVACITVSLLVSSEAQTLKKMEAVNFSEVMINDKFWKPRIDKVSSVTIPVCIAQTEFKTARIRNFEKVARNKGEKHEGVYYDDSDVYKALEAIAYSLKNHPDKTLEEKADDWIDKIAAAQLPDGYLNTYYTLTGIDKRWTDMEKHEDYNAGHLFEAATAYYSTTGKRKLLDVAIRFANHIDSTFRLQNKHWVSGHEEIELALVKLSQASNNPRYLELADWYLEQRGHGYGKGAIWANKSWGAKYCQDDVPLKEQKEITGHAVRAMYLYTGAADVGAEKNDSGYMNAMKRVWEDVVYRNMYITGGIGSSGRNEGFSADYDLPNEDAYCETCASVGMVLWNQRMNLLTGESKYIDVLERSLYNGALDGLSLSGNRFFYGNPLASDGKNERSEWFGTACCPSNIARLVESLGNYVYAKSTDALWVNLYVGSSTSVSLQKGKVQLQQQTNYPWDGAVKIAVNPERPLKFALQLRIPGWAQNEPVPGKTYQYADINTDTFTVRVNSKPVNFKMEHGYAVIDREWKKGDVVTLDLPMPVRKVQAVDSIRQDKNRVAIQRGPLVYCFEYADNNGKAMNFFVPAKTVFSAKYNNDLLDGVVTLSARAPVVEVSADGSAVLTTYKSIMAIPYYAWANRGPGQMQVWVPERAGNIKVGAE